MSRSRQTEERERRRERKDPGQGRRRLSVPMSVHQWAARNNKELRFFNDDKNRIQQAFDDDWDFVKFMGGKVGEVETAEQMGDGYSVLVGVKENGDPMKAYLMAKNKDWFKSDQDEKQKEVDAIDSAIREGRVKPGEGQYVKDIKYKPHAKYQP